LFVGKKIDMNNFALSGLYKIGLFLGFALVLNSCNEFSNSDHTAYFGGEIINPKTKWVLLYKDNELIDSIPLDEHNRFFAKYDSLPSGLYAFHHEPEFQYVYFDKNDSLMLRLNTHDFDGSLVFCGRGEEKNNFLIEMYLLNKIDKDRMYPSFDLNPENFLKVADSSYNEMLAFYKTKKEKLKWSEDFDLYAKAATDFHYYTKREFYPIAHQRRNPLDSLFNIPDGYYDFRKGIASDNEKLAHFMLYVRYFTARIDNLVFEETANLSEDSVFLAKLEFLDSMIESSFLKSKIASNIVYFYLAEAKELSENDKVLKKYAEISTDIASKERINKLATSVRNMASGKKLPEIILTDDKAKISSNELFKSKTVLFFWSKKSEPHCFSVHKKVNELAQKYTNIQFVGINVDEDFPDRKEFLSKNKLLIPEVKQYQVNSTELREKWATTRFSQALIINQDGTIDNAFANIFDVGFDKNL
jgi:thiol-disulfide isomerase/thioredoxin